MATHTLETETYRRELTVHCYRFFGSLTDAEDAVQETMLRAWTREKDLEKRSSLRKWLYSIATNVCIDMQRAPQRRSLPMDLVDSGNVPTTQDPLTTRPERTWIGPIPDARLGHAGDPSELTLQRDSVRLAFIATLQHLPPRQRAVLILRDVLAWSAKECAELLDDSVASINSALSRARLTMAEHDPAGTSTTLDDAADALLREYVSAFEAFDISRLVELLAEDARFSMPPFELWLRGRDSIEQWWRGPGQVCRNARTIITTANGQPAVAVYHSAGPGQWAPFAIHVLDVADDRISMITQFIGPEHFHDFGLPPKLDEHPA
ncbi:sigma-70 family RNA polymerase sigma factor [Dietzia timorensis]|uniref:RNA polymerase sigma factor SigW n=1 Tax=Dietzia timorensis TaxID=499555 RepID=A0A173LM94_9ACTN|nr:sigma-70 family RNA polymerase sigma factor [Dietzia timorensis]ANI93386.1 RNA polymerase sigma factor SigW [Dietzia timorensis]